ncbi:MAG: DUF349 domain-containing protein [Proteobacteria bacterium]|nr:DUF349 domain-containing protein [Pseudomonadota bacterium]
MSILTRLINKDPAGDGTTPAAVPAAAPAPDPAVEAAARARDEEAAVAAALAAGDGAALARWVLEGSSSRVRQQAAQAIQDPEQLRELIRAVRGGNDKNVYRILTATRDAQLADIRGVQQQQADAEATAAAIARHAVLPYDPLNVATIEQLARRWESLATHAPAGLAAEVAAHLERAASVVREHERSLAEAAARESERQTALENASREREAATAAAAEAAAAATAEQAQLAEAAREAARLRQETEGSAVREIVGLLRQAQAALDRGSTARAARLHETLAARLPGAPALPPWFARQWQTVEARVAELRDWKTFTVAPKRAELLRRMQGLIGAEMSPEELARRIKGLQEEWRTLARGAPEEQAPEWQPFQEAANKAYEPCREHFARQAAVRRENQQRRESLLARLAAFAAEQLGEDADWRHVGRVLAEARDEWRRYAPVDQAVVKGLQERFHAQLGEIQGRLQAEIGRHVETKRALISRAAELIAAPDTRAAIDEAKQLQRRWQATGYVPRETDGGLWAEFRRHCDAIFARSAQESAAFAAALDAQESRATALCAELEALAGLEGDALRSGARELDRLRGEFDGIELPRRSARELRQRFSKASTRLGEALRRDRAAAAGRAWDEVYAAADALRGWRLAQTPDADDAEATARREAAAAAIGALGETPKGVKALLERRFAATEPNAPADLAANEAALRLLCVRAELGCDMPSPEPDQSLRREYQMKRLVESMGRGEPVAAASPDELALAWLAVGPVADAAYAGLVARFRECHGRATRSSGGGHR